MRVLGTTASGVANETIPTAPQSFTSTAISSTQINLSWAAPASNGGATITSYTLRRSGTVIYTGPATSFSNTGLSPATGYSYTVLATNSVGDGPTAFTSRTTLATVPTAPTSFSASGVNSSTINLSWGAPSSNGGAAVTSYTLRRNGGVIYTGAGTSFSDGGLAPASGYGYTVVANNSVGAGPAASTSASTTAGVPAAPSINWVYITTEMGQDSEGNSDGTFVQIYRIDIYHGSNNGSAVHTTQLQIWVGQWADWFALSAPDNNSYSYIGVGQGGSVEARAYDINGVGAGPAGPSATAYGQ
jgi:chitodextrinase